MSAQENPIAKSVERLAAHRASGRSMPADLKARLQTKYLQTKRDEVLLEDLNEALDKLGVSRADGTRFEGRGIVIKAGSGSGKSFSIYRVLAKHPMFPEFVGNKPGNIAISVRCLGSSTLKLVGIEIAKKLGYPLSETLHENVVWARVRQKLREGGVVLIHIDEVNSLLRKASSPERDRIVDAFKGLLNDEVWPVVLVLSGTERIEEVIKAHDPDREFWRRMRWRTYERLALPRDNKMIASHIGVLCKAVDLAYPDTLASTVVPRLIHAARYQLGHSIEIAIDAIEAAWKKKSPILTIEHFADVTAKTGCASDQNPFTATEWWTIKIADPDGDDTDDASKPRRGGRKRERR